MNIISNCCLAADYCKLKNIQFPNPLMWCHINLSDLSNLILNYENINFNNYELKTCNWNDIYKPKKYNKNFEHILGLQIDNLFTAWFTHYIFSNNDNIPRINGADVYAKNIFQYLIDAYIRRKNRMSKEPPVFVFIFGRYPDETKDACINFIKKSINTKYKILIFTHYKELTNFDNEKIKIIYDTKEAIDFPPNVLKKYIKEIDKFIKG